ncbi:MAG: hypothetical protein WCA12_17095 [Burkholderiales bacterium]
MPQTFKIDLRVVQSRRNSAVAELIADLLDGKAAREQALCASVSEAVGADSRQCDAERAQTPMHECRNARSRQGAQRRLQRQKQRALSAPGPHLPQISHDRIANGPDQRKVLHSALLGAKDSYRLGLPVEILQLQACDFPTAQPINGQKQYDRPIANLCRLIASRA